MAKQPVGGAENQKREKQRLGGKNEIEKKMKSSSTTIKSWSEKLEA
jgi:hypothetical protein